MRRCLPGTRLRLPLALGGALVVTAIVATLAVAATTASVPKVSMPTTKPMSDADAALVEGRVSFLTDDDDFPGVLLGVWDPVKGYTKLGVGVADKASRRAPTASDTWRIGSVTKTFTATVILQLVAEGRLRLDGRVAAYAPKLVKRHPALGTRTIRQLLAMRSGLPEYTDAMIGAATANGWTTKVWTPNQTIDFAFKSGPVKPAGARPAVYTNTNYITLGEIAQTVTGMTLPQLVRTRVLRPLALTKTVYPRITDTSLPQPATRGYVGTSGAEESAVEPGTDVTTWSASWGGAAGIMMSTLDDMGLWAASRFGSALLPAKLRVTRSAAPVPLNAGGTYGLGIQRFGEWEGHFGGIPGWTTMVMRNTKSGAIVVASVNACCGVQSGVLLQLVLARLYPGTTS